MGVAGEIGKHRFRPGEGRLGVNEPFLALERREMRGEGLGATQALDRAEEGQPACRVGIDERGVTVRYKDYRRNGRARFGTMTLMPNEFIRRFLLHVLPKRFHRIRHYGLLASAGCKANIARAKELMTATIPEINPPAAHDTADPHTTTDYRPPCPCCGGRMIIVEVFARGGVPRAPPAPDAGVSTATP